MNDPERYDLVKQMFRLMLTGTYSIPKFVDEVDRTMRLRMKTTKKHPMERKLRPGSVHKMLLDPFYWILRVAERK